MPKECENMAMFTVNAGHKQGPYVWVCSDHLAVLSSRICDLYDRTVVTLNIPDPKNHPQLPPCMYGRLGDTRLTRFEEVKASRKELLEYLEQKKKVKEFKNG